MLHFSLPKEAELHYLASFSMLALLTTVLLASALAAQQIPIDLDTQKTQIEFVVNDVLHTVRGTFRLKAGHIELNPASGDISGRIVVDAASGESGNATRDRRMSRNILEAQRFPEIFFTPAKIEGAVSLTADSSIAVTGQLVIHGQAHEITVPMQTHSSANEITASGKFLVPYVQWGMKNPSTLFLRVNDKVEVHVTLACRLASQTHL